MHIEFSLLEFCSIFSFFFKIYFLLFNWGNSVSWTLLNANIDYGEGVSSSPNCDSYGVWVNIDLTSSNFSGVNSKFYYCNYTDVYL